MIVYWPASSSTWDAKVVVSSVPWLVSVPWRAAEWVERPGVLATNGVQKPTLRSQEWMLACGIVPVGDLVLGTTIW